MPSMLGRTLQIALGGSLPVLLQSLGATALYVPRQLLSETSPNLVAGADVNVTGISGSAFTTKAVRLQDYPAAIEGTPTRGVPGPLPEGRMAMTFDGVEDYLRIPGDAVNLSPGAALSFSPPNIRLGVRSVVIIFKGGTAGEPLVTRVEDDDDEIFALTTNSWFGKSFADASDPDEWIVLVATAKHGDAQVWVNGTQVLDDTVAQVNSYGSAGHMYVGRNAAGDAFFGGSIALVAYVDAYLEQDDVDAIQATMAWTTVNQDWLGNHETDWDYGIPGDGPADVVASPGSLRFVLNNSERNAAGLLGYWTPGHANAPAGWERGAPVRLLLSYAGTTYCKFHGRVDRIDPETGPKGLRTVAVEAVDWWHEADRGSLSSLETRTDVRCDDAIRRVLDDMEESPGAVSLDQGIDTFPFVFDDAAQANPAPTTEIARLCQSERARAYNVGNAAGGMTLRVESRHTRAFAFTAERTLDRDMLDLRAPRDRADIATKVRATIRPRKVAGATEVLWSLEGAAIQIGPNEPPRIIRGVYRDPNQQVASISGTDLVTPLEPGVDFIVNSLESGLGDDITSEFEVDFQHGGISPIFTIRNLGSKEGWILPGNLQVRGKGLYRYTEIITEAVDAELTRKYGENLITLSLPYQSSPQNAQGIVDQELARRGDELKLAKEVEFFATDTEDHLLTALLVEPGTRVEILNDLGAIDIDYFVQHVAYRLLEGHLWVTWLVAPADREALFIFDDPVYGVFDGVLGRMAHV